MDKHGAFREHNHCRFSVWSPESNAMMLHLVAPKDRVIAMQKDADGYFRATVKDLGPDVCYYYRPEGGAAYPDPASFAQPQGVHGPSMVVDHHTFSWSDQDWKGIEPGDMVIYEIHVGTYTPSGTFEAIIERLDELADLGVNTLELMPVAAFPGERNWGYDGVYPFAVQQSYGGPQGLKRLVNACHSRGMAVLLDVVYNHLGPEGNYLHRFGPYFNERYRTPWGPAINYDGAWSDGVREFFAENIIYWFRYFHIDGLRLDAIHAIIDTRADSFWNYALRKVRLLERRAGRRHYLMAESDSNDPRVVAPAEQCGLGFDALWLDDFHHALFTLIQPDRHYLYEDFGATSQLAKAFNEGFVHSGEFVKARKRRHGVSSAGIPGNRFIAFIQNHDLVGNMTQGERLSVQVDRKKLKLAAAALLLSPYIPLLFMGEEYGESHPFLFFTSYSDPGLIQAVRDGRAADFAAIFRGETQPDPQDETTFLRSKPAGYQHAVPPQQDLREWYKLLLKLRKQLPALQCFDKQYIRAEPLPGQGLQVYRTEPGKTSHLLALFNFGEAPIAYTFGNMPVCWEPVCCNDGNAAFLQAYRTRDLISIPAHTVVALHASEPG